MKRTATVVCLRECGTPEEAVRVEEWDLPAVAAHQVLVRVQAAPVNPADLNVLEGNYAIQPGLPAVVGMEGVGVIAEVGSGVTNRRVGQRVLAPVRPGWWCTARVLDAADVFPIPAELSRETAAMLTINPPTAWRLLRDFVALAPGDWVIQNAANSAVGRFVIQLARHCGWRTVNLVRRPELVAELQAIGADVVVTDGTPLHWKIDELTGGTKALLGLNAVGGESARVLARSLGSGGTLVTYGAMAREPLRIDNSALIFRDIRFRGFWISEWFRRAARAQIEEMFGQLLPLARAGQLAAPVERAYSLAEAPQAIAHARRSSRSGKILLVMD